MQEYSLSRAIFRAGRREEVMLAKMSTSDSRLLGVMAVNLDHQYLIFPTRYRSAYRSREKFLERGLKVVDRQPSRKTTENADDRGCVDGGA